MRNAVACAGCPGGKRKSNAGRRFPPEVLSQAEVLRLLEACSPGPMGVRNRAMLAVLYRSGLRISEALKLEAKDLDLDAGAIRVLHAKGGRSRTVGIDPTASAMVIRWMEVRATLGVPVGRPVFCMADGRPLYHGYIRVLMPRLGRLAGIEKRVHAHGLRHAHASELRREGVDIAVISRQLGHRSIATTSTYLNHLEPYAVVEAMRSRVWSARPSVSEPAQR